MKPLLSYYGGKQRIASRIVEVIDTIPHTVYCEPFFGGGAVFFARQRPMVSDNNYYREVVNDSSKALINLYRVARENPADFERWIQFTPYSQEEHRRAIAICKEPENVTPLEWAWAYYVNIHQSFANKLSAGWGVRTLSENGAAAWDNRKRNIPECLDRLSSVHISCEDALAVIKRWDSPHTLHYLDPPYPDTECGHYDGYTKDDLRRLCDLLDTIEGSYILSGYDCNIEPQSAQQRIEINATCHASGQGKVRNGDRSRKATQEELGDRKRTEVLWVCDRSAKARKELQGIMRVKQFSLLDL